MAKTPSEPDLPPFDRKAYLQRQLEKRRLEHELMKEQRIQWITELCAETPGLEAWLKHAPNRKGTFASVKKRFAKYQRRKAREALMPTGPKGQKRPADVIGNAVKIARIATGEDEDVVPDDGKNKAAQELGREGGKKRAASMTPERRAEIARKAASTRWSKK